MILKVAIMNPAPHLKLELEDKVLTNHTLRMNQEMKRAFVQKNFLEIVILLTRVFLHVWHTHHADSVRLSVQEVPPRSEN